MPWDARVGQRGGGHARDDGGFRAQVFGSRRQLAARGVHHRHRVFDGDRLRAAGLHIAFRAAQHRQDDRVAADQQLRAVQLGVHVHRQVQAAHAGLALACVGQRHGQVAAQADQHARVPVHHRLHAVDGVMPMALGRAETERLFKVVEHHRVDLFGDADAAVALHIGMPAQRADAGAGLAEVASHQQQRGDLLHVLRAARVLGDTHAVGDDGGVGLGVGGGHLFQFRARQAAGLFDVSPVGVVQVLCVGVKPVRVFRDEGVIQDAGRLAVRLHQRLHDALERRRVAADLHLVVGGRDAGRAERAHFNGVLRVGKAFQRAFTQGVEHNDRHAAPRAFMQGAHHARVIGAGVVAHRDDQVAGVEIIERHRALADADGFRQADAGGLVAHVRAVGKVVGA
ncbi:hypothetical protein D3C71_1173660 [compost metagenome]